MDGHVRKTGLLAAALAAALAACTAGPQAEPGFASTAVSAELGQQDYAEPSAEQYRLRPADVLRITVFREADLSQESVPVSVDGQVSMPLLGTLDVEGMTTAELEDLITTRLDARYLRNPSVSVNVIEFASHRVTVEGSVETPGIYDFRPGTRLSGAIALAEGTTRTADARNVIVFRDTDEGMTVARFDYRAMQEGTMIDPVLMPGDRVVVGTDGMSQAWQDMLQAIPVFALFTRI